MILVVGANGLLGSAVVRHLRARCTPMATASHRCGADFHLDLHTLSEAVVATLSCGVSHALIASAITSIDACARDPSGTWAFNVDATVALTDALGRHEVLPVFCSSDLVFRGDRGGYREDDSREPTTEYGRQKKAVEDHLLSADYPSVIVRMSKLYTLDPDDRSPVGDTLNRLTRGETVLAASDQTVSPTLVDEVAAGLVQVMSANRPGVFHVASGERFTRYTLARTIAERLGLEYLVQERSIDDFALSEPRPKDNSLISDRIVAEFSVRFSTVETNLGTILERRGMRPGNTIHAEGEQ